MSLAKDFGRIIKNSGQSYVIDWKIEDFYSKLLEQTGTWESPKFHFCGNTWHLRFRNDKGNYFVNSISVDLYTCGLHSSIHGSHIYGLGIKGRNGNIYKVHFFNDSTMCNLFTISRCYGSYAIDKLELQKEKSTFDVEGTVTISCVIHVSYTSRANASSQTVLCNGARVLIQDLKKMFQGEECTDVTFKVQGQEFHAHSQILTARCPNFALKLRHDVIQEDTRVVEIEGYEPEAFKQLIIYLYSGECENMSLNNVVDLYRAAHNYSVYELKTECIEFMQAYMSVDRFCDFVRLSINYSDSELKSYTKDFFVKNMKKIIQTEKWISFVMEYPREMNEFIIALAQYLPY